jgi:metal-responsive CopG/Arc/MetJ family transcriptional regulator
MKIKTSITVASEILEDVDRLADKGNRSEFIERALRSYIARITRERLNLRDKYILNQKADSLNAEVADVVEFLAYKL